MDCNAGHANLFAETLSLAPSITIASVYFKPGVRDAAFKKEMENLSQFLANRSNGIITGDLNAKLTVFRIIKKT